MNWTEEQLAAYMSGLRQPSGEPVAAADSPKESLIEAECSRILEEDGWRALRTDPVSDRSKGKGFGELGMADFEYIRYEGPHWGDGSCAHASVMWIEWKSAKGKPKSHQIAWHIRERARGALTLIAGQDFPATIDGFKDYYEKSGLMRRKRWW